MNRKEIIIGIGAILVSISIVIGGYLISDAIKTANIVEVENTTEGVMDLPEVANYLNMSQVEVRAIIRLEDDQLKQFGSFTGKMFPYFTINDKQYFYRDEVDEWLKEVASNHTIYDSNKGFILQ